MNWNEKQTKKGLKGFQVVPDEKQKKEVVKARLSGSQKEILKAYCKTIDLSVSDFIRLAIYEKLKVNNVTGLDGKLIIDENQLALFDKDNKDI